MGTQSESGYLLLEFSLATAVVAMVLVAMSDAMSFASIQNQKLSLKLEGQSFSQIVGRVLQSSDVCALALAGQNVQDAPVLNLPGGDIVGAGYTFGDVQIHNVQWAAVPPSDIQDLPAELVISASQSGVNGGSIKNFRYRLMVSVAADEITHCSSATEGNTDLCSDDLNGILDLSTAQHECLLPEFGTASTHANYEANHVSNGIYAERGIRSTGRLIASREISVLGQPPAVGDVVAGDSFFEGGLILGTSNLSQGVGLHIEAETPAFPLRYNSGGQAAGLVLNAVDGDGTAEWGKGQVAFPGNMLLTTGQTSCRWSATSCQANEYLKGINFSNGQQRCCLLRTSNAVASVPGNQNPPGVNPPGVNPPGVNPPVPKPPMAPNPGFPKGPKKGPKKGSSGGGRR